VLTAGPAEAGPSVLDIRIRQATRDDAPAVRVILTDAAKWVEQLDGTTMWVEDELGEDRIASEVHAGLFFIAECDGDIAGAMKFQLQDPLFWPDLVTDDSAFVHRLAVRRNYAGRGVSTALLRWAVVSARSLGRHALRLDCDAERSRLRGLYERFGFRFHSLRQVGSYYVARYELQIRDM
jgi:GNAT superfamily N-acetyltransferase